MLNIESLLPMVQKPARYTGGEINEIVKAAGAQTVRFAFCFPDTYEVGMSHLGMKILYHALNAREDTVCERVFAPWVDMEEAMRGAGMPLFSLETRTPVREFDIVGFTLQYEMSYTNILNMLALAGIPLLSTERGEDMPLVVAGGPCAYNPEPLADFVDLFIIGDGELATQELVALYARMRSAPRSEFLRQAAREIAGAYVPSLYEASYDGDGNFSGIEPLYPDVPRVVRRAVLPNLEDVVYPDRIIVPNTEIVHDRIMLEVARGCTRGCRFCQAGMIYRPQRERSVGRLVSLADSLVCSTGYEEISLTSLSTGDYSQLEELAGELMQRHAQDRVSVSLPSLRLDSVVKKALSEAASVRKSGLTFAPEAGSQRLRDVINKGVTAQMLYDQARDAFGSGYSAVKLYFMVGLPTETYEDLDGIVELARGVVNEYFRLPKEQRSPKGIRVAVSTSSFVPKPHTPFAWCAQDTMQTLKDKQRYLRERLKIRGVEYRYHDPETSLLEAVFARGDRRLGAVLRAAHGLGCRFDGWLDQFSFEKWQAAFAQCGMTPEAYAHREIALDAPLPWDHIDCGVTKAFQKREYRRAMEAQVTPDCKNGCLHCGMAALCGGTCPCA